VNGRVSVLLPPGGKTRTDSWATPEDLFAGLNAEFGFTLDPCPIGHGMPLFGADGLLKPWAGERVFCNPPYTDILPWLARAREAEVAVYLVPVRSDTRWWHEHAMYADEIRFIRGRLRFSGQPANAPFPSAILVYRSPR
jgi:hypothetical protein